MRNSSSLSVRGQHLSLAASCFALLAPLLARPLSAQEPTPAPTPAPTTTPAEQSATPPTAQPERPAEGERRGGGRRRQTLVLEAGTVHPVAGPAIENGVVVLRGERIVAVGKKGEVEVPPNATVRSFPTGHVYPGLIDAATDAYTDGSLSADGSNDGGSHFADDLRMQGTRSDELARAGITTAYVTVRSPAVVRGQGAVVRPTKDGFEPWTGKDHAALQLRLTNGIGASHALQRQQQLQAANALFEGLEEFRKAKTDHDEALKKYEKEFADYLAWHQKKKDEKKDDKPAEGAGAEKPAAPAAERPAPPREGRPRGNRGGGGGGGGEPPKAPDSAVTVEELEAALATLLAALPQDPPKPPEPVKQDPAKQEPKPGDAPAGTPPGAPAPEKKDEAPKRPTYPKAPASDPQRDALQQVVDGELPLRVEAHRADEVRAALKLQRDRQIPQLVLEQAYGADACAADIARQGASVVLTETMAPPFEPPYDTFDPAGLPAKLHAAGVPFAIASGRAINAALLPLAAATAVGRGLPADAALRAITLSAAEILGVAQETGSLQAGKYGDVVVSDRPLFTTDARILLVLAKGRTEYEAK